MIISRRNLLKSSVAAPFVLRAHATLAADSAVVLRPRAVVINGKPVYLVAGSIDYFRCPHQLWRDRLIKAKRSGLNMVMTNIAWNFHERDEGVFHFEGDCDIGHFLDLCNDLGLYSFVRAGPFICDEWDGGGYPAWLIGKPNVELRAFHQPTLIYVRRWFEKLIPQIARRQVTQKGSVVFVQQENEYYYVGRPGVKEYQDFLISALRELGIEVPITDCNGFSSEVRRPASIQTVNGGGARNVEELQKTQPGKPAFVSELYTDYMNCWGWPISSYPTTEMVYQQTMQTLAAGGMYSFFMMYGGSNFGFWASTTWKSDQSFITTRYYSRAPIAEGEALNETYFAVKAANVLARSFESFLTAGEACPSPARFSGPVNARAIKTPRGHLIFVEPIFPVDDSAVYRMDGRGPVITLEERWPMAELANHPGTLELPSGESMPLAEPSSYPSMLPFGLSIGPDCVIDYANATLLGIAGDAANRVLLVRGTAGRSGIASVNNKRLDFLFPAIEPAQFKSGEVTVFALSPETADRTWFADGRVIIGPAFVGERRGDQHECYLDGSETSIHIISERGKIERRSIAPKAISVMPQISLTNWRSFPMPEISSSKLGWRELEEPRGVEDLKAYWGYTWYRASYDASTPGRAGLFFTEAADRLHVFANGKRMGVWGRGSGAVRDPLEIEITAGNNDFVFLCDNMGRLSEGKCIDRKGIRGEVYVGAKARSLGEPEWSVSTGPPTHSWEYQTYAAFIKGSFLRATWTLETGGDDGLVLALRSIPQYAGLR